VKKGGETAPKKGAVHRNGEKKRVNPQEKGGKDEGSSIPSGAIRRGEEHQGRNKKNALLSKKVGRAGSRGEREKKG